MRDVAGSIVSANQAGGQLATLRQLLTLREKIAAAEQKAAASRFVPAAGGSDVLSAAPTRRQAAELQKLTTAAQKSEASLAALAARERELSATLRDAGVDLGNVNAEQQRLAMGAAQIRPLSGAYKELTSQVRGAESALRSSVTQAGRLQAALRADGVSTAPGAAASLTAVSRATAAARAQSAAQAQALFSGIAEAARAQASAPGALGVRSFREIQGEIATVRQALAVYRRLRAEGAITFNEMAGASSAARARISALKAELGIL
ncbi:hypothetical protein [Panacagrimonas sp.]|uniref:hypothetical protein n=1 Tax=Panacagrimonas sp. TaxID=2480088 RepID=UPI003B51EEFC